MGHDESTAASPIDLAGIQAKLAATPRELDVAAWRVGGADLWPLICTTLESLAIHIHLGTGGLFRRGSYLWQAAVLAESGLAAPALAALPKPELPVPPDQLAGAIVLCGSRINARDIGGVLVAAPLDVPAIVLRRGGERSICWYEDMHPADPLLATALHPPARGLRPVLALARRTSHRPGTVAELSRLPGLAAWCAQLAQLLHASPAFLLRWLARQVNLLLATARAFGLVLERRGRPKAVLLLNAGHASTAGLALAAHRESVPVIEVYHGVERDSAITSARMQPHFSRFNTAPSAVVSWELEPRRDPLVLSVGPIELHLPGLLAAASPEPGTGQARLIAHIDAQAAALARKVSISGARYEVLISALLGERMAWLDAVVAGLPDDAYIWLRRHPSDRQLALPAMSSFQANRMDVDLASSVLLPLLLRRCAVHVTRFSAVTLEAAAMGVPTVATDPYAGVLFKSRVAEGLFSCVEGGAGLATLADAAARRRGQAGPASLPDIGRLPEFVARIVAQTAAAPPPSY